MDPDQGPFLKPADLDLHSFKNNLGSAPGGYSYFFYTACCYYSFIVFANDARQYEKLVIFNPCHAAFLYSTFLPLY